MKKFSYVLIYVLITLFLCACSSNNVPSDAVSFQATVTEITDNSMLVRPVDGSDELNSSVSFSIALSNLSDTSSLQIGDTLEISYNGDILETYPATLAKIYRITILTD